LDPQNPARSPTCSRCGSPFNPRAEGDLCPKCLFSDVFAQDSSFNEALKSQAPEAPALIRYFGDYELEGEIARGGMGVIHRARQVSLGRTVAIKLMSAGEFARPEVVKRFRTEAMAAAKLQHPNIVAIHEVGEYQGLQYYSMDPVEGPNLAAQLAGQTLPARRAAQLCKTLAETVQYAHDRGILHRDLKPSNVLIDPFGQPRITDFGLAKDITAESDLTVTGQVLGTPGFLPPEQADSTRGQIGPGADVYSLGAVLYFTLTGRPPFVGGSVHETLRQVLTDDPVAPRLLNSGVPRDLETICLKCLERDPARRYLTAAELAADLGRFLDGHPIHARPVSPAGRFLRWCRRRPAIATAWALVVSLAIGSSIASVLIQRARVRTQAALNEGRARLRESLISEARAVMVTLQPGRRAKALAALAEASRIRPGPDIRHEAYSALLLWDLTARETWKLDYGFGGYLRFDESGKRAVNDIPRWGGGQREPSKFVQWNSTSTAPTTVTLEAPAPAIGPFDFSLNGKRVIGRFEDHTIRVWEFGQPEPFLVVSNNPAPIVTKNDVDTDDVRISPDGTRFVTGRKGGGLSMFRVSDGTEIARWESSTTFNQVRFSPNGTRIAGIFYGDRTKNEILVFDTELHLAVTIPLSHPSTSFSWSADSSQINAALDDGTVEMYDAKRGWVAARIVSNITDAGKAAYFGEDNLLLIRSMGMIARIFNAKLGKEELVMGNTGPSGFRSRKNGMEFIATTTLGDGQLWTFDPPAGYRILPGGHLPAQGRFYNHCGMDFSPGGEWVVTSHAGQIRLRDVATGRLLDELDVGTTNRIEYAMVALQDAGRTLIRSSGDTGLWRHRITQTPEGPKIGPGERLDSVPKFLMTSHTADGRRIVQTSAFQNGDEEVRVVDVTEQGAREIRRWKLNDAFATAISPDGTRLLVSGAGERPIQVYRIEDGTLLNNLDSSSHSDICWDGPGNLVMGADGANTTAFWDSTTWKRVVTLTGDYGAEDTVFSISPDGKEAVLLKNQRITLFSLPACTVRMSFDRPLSAGNVSGLKYLPDGKRFAVLWQDGRIDLFDPDALRTAGLTLGIQ
jgi:hypothetical protein